MVKIDPEHDYYADLKCPNGANEGDIKRAYHKLAKEYHPDRNRGNEDEASKKFQLINAAHEILTDPDKRAKYDNARLRGAGFRHVPAKGPTPDYRPRSPFGNPPQPPRRNQASPPFGPPPTSKGAPTGAARYAKFTADPKGWAKDDDYVNKAQAATAWDRMWYRMPPKDDARGGSKRDGPPPKPARERMTRAKGGWDADSPKRPEQEHARRPPWENEPPRYNGQAEGVPSPGLRRSNTTTSPRKPGFYPGAPGGDEPPAKSTSAYFTSPRNSIHYNPRPQSMHASPQPNDPRMPHRVDIPKPDPLRHFKEAAGVSNSDRLRTPYNKSGGEKTNIHDNGYFSGLNRSSSTADNLQDGWNDNLGGNRAQGARHRSASPRVRSPLPPDEEESSSLDESEVAQNAAKKNPFTRKPRRTSGQYFNKPSSNGFRHPDYPDVTVEEDGNMSPRSAAPPMDPKAFKHQKQHATGQSASRMASAGPGEPPTQPQMEERNHETAYNLRASISKESDLSSPPVEKSKAWFERYGPGKAGADQRHFEPPKSAGNEPRSGFHLPTDSSASASPERPTSEGNQPFSPSEWHEKFSGDASAYLGPQPDGKQPRGRSPPKDRSRGSRTRPSASVDPPPAAQMSPPRVPPREADVSPSKFPQEEWQKEFEGSEWAYPTQNAQNTARRSKAPRKMSAASKKNAPKAASVAPAQHDGADTEEGAAAERAGRSRSRSGSAMDIDPPNVNEAKSRKTNASASAERDTSAGAKQSALNMGDLKKTAPFADDGLNGMSDMYNNLPFESRASGKAPPGHAHAAPGPKALPIPHVPNMPERPDRAAGGLTRAGWERYRANVGAYMHEWTRFNERMIKHFAARQAKNPGLPADWDSAAGEAGWREYCWGVEEDFRPRAAWDLAWAQHKANLDELAEVRGKAIRGEFAG